VILNGSRSLAATAFVYRFAERIEVHDVRSNVRS
jgi:hypothetical protein